MRRLALVAVAGAIAVSTLTAGCASNNPSPVSAAAAKALRPLVLDLRTAAAGKSTFAAQQAEQALVNEVQQLLAGNDLSPKRAQSIDDAAALLLSDFRRHNQPTPTPTPSTPTPTPSTESPTPTPTVTVTVPPTDTATPTPTETVTLPTGKKSKSPKPFVRH